MVPLHSSLGYRARLHLKKRKNKRDEVQIYTIIQMDIQNVMLDKKMPETKKPLSI